MKIYRCTLLICEACLDAVGQECHTPMCALFLHRVDILKIDRDLLEQCEFVAEDHDA